MILYKSDEHPRTPLELWDGSALIPNTMFTTLVLFLLWNKNLEVNKLEFVRAVLSQHFFTGPDMTVLT